MELSVFVQQCRSEAFVRSNNERAEQIMAMVDTENLKTELRYYLSALYNTNGENILQPQRVEGPEHFPVLLHVNEILKRNKARIRAITLDARDYKTTADSLLSKLERILHCKPEFYELKTAEMRKIAVKMIGRELVELQEEMSAVVDMGTDIGKEFSDQLNAASAEYNIVNAMSYQRGLYGGNGIGPAPTPQNTRIQR